MSLVSHTKRNGFLLLMLGFFAAATMGLSRLSNPQFAQTTYRERVPLYIDGWRGTLLPVEQRIKNALKTEDIFFGRYSHPAHEQHVDLVVVSIPSALLHPPEMCFRGGGWEQTDGRIEYIQLSGFKPIPMKRMTLQQADENLMVLYTYRVKDRFLTNYWLYEVLQTLRPGVGPNMLIRVSTPPGKDELTAKAVLMRFSAQVVRHLENTITGEF